MADPQVQALTKKVQELEAKLNELSGAPDVVDSGLSPEAKQEIGLPEDSSGTDIGKVASQKRELSPSQQLFRMIDQLRG